MPAKRLTMRQIRELLRLKHGCGASERGIAEQLRIARSTVADYLGRAREAGLSWPLPETLGDTELERRLFAGGGVKPGRRQRFEPDWEVIHLELKRPGVTLMILWEEYRQAHPTGYSYSRFCELYRAFAKRLSPTMRQVHVAGEKVFVDYSGKLLEIIDRDTGEVHQAQLFVGVLGASSYTYIEASWSQSLPDWIASHVRMFRFFGSVPRLLVSDNLKAAVIKACFHDPSVNLTYADMASHYGMGVLPARPRRPKDKAKVEVGVKLAQSYILGRLRNVRFFSLAEANTAIAEVREQLNERPIRRLGVSRRQLFVQVEQPALRPLPPTDYCYAEWKQPLVNQDYHVDLHRFYYSVPCRLVGEKVEARITAHTIEIFHRGKRVAAHPRRYRGQRFATLGEHMPDSHRRYSAWSCERFKSDARRIGPNTLALITRILDSRPHPEQGFRTCVGLLRLFRGIDRQRAEAVCAHALDISALSQKSVTSILDNNLDRAPKSVPPEGPAIRHANIRGARYYS